MYIALLFIIAISVGLYIFNKKQLRRSTRKWDRFKERLGHSDK